MKWLLATVALAAAMRIACVDWGLPLTIPQVASSDIRTTYAFDEDTIVGNAALTNPAAGDFDPRRYFLGTLHYHLTTLWLGAAEALGLFRHPWREAYLRMIPGQFERVYVIARCLSIAIGLSSLIVIYWMGRLYGGDEVGLWAALFAAVAPVHLLLSTQVRPDLTAMTLVALAVALVFRAPSRAWAVFCTGAVAGLAVAAKHPAVFVAYPVALLASRFTPRMLAIVTAGFGLAIFVGEPYLTLRFSAALEETRKVATGYANIPEQYRIGVIELLGRQAGALARFGLGLAVTLLAVVGLVRMCRRRTARDIVLLVGTGGAVVSLISLKWPLLRYLILFVPFLSLAAASVVARVPGKLRFVVGGAAAVAPFFASLAQVHYMTSPHPANQMMEAIVKTIPEGTPVARLMAKLIPLSLAVYPLGPNPFMDDLRKAPPEWVVMTDLPDGEYPLSTRETLAARYAEVARFGIEQASSWATLGEWGAPHDWKYTHPEMILYRLKP